MMKRRDALKAMGGIAGAATIGKVLPGCGGGDDGPVGITTMVFMMMENRSYDHLMGARALEGLGGNGLTAAMTNPNMAGDAVPIFEVGGADAVCVLDPPHGWESCRAQMNGGLMDGFVTAYEAAHSTSGLNQVMGYLTRAHEPVTWALADSYTSCDQWHCSVLGPTIPNRMYWHSGTSQGQQDNRNPSGGIAWDTIYHRLYDKSIDWTYYYGDVPTLAFITGLPGLQDRLQRMEKFFEDAEAGTLPPVVYIDPAFSMNDDHPPHHTILGQQLIASVYTALANSPQWKNTLFVLTYDEHGGYFDHVAPPSDGADEFADLGFNQLGIRVPALVMGPYAKQGAVVSTRYEHSSALKHIQNHFGLEPLWMRTEQASDLTDCLDLDRLERGEWAEPAEIPAVEVNESDITDACTGSAEGRVSHPILELADQHPELFKRWDRRGDALREYVYRIGDVLERYNAGRIVRGK
jgi:phospholipase C